MPQTTDTTAPADVKLLDLAWAKTQTGLQQEAEGHKLWIEGTLELINILDDARKRLGSDQAFGTWLTDNGYGERITRHDRAALLNMARDLNVTREVLEQTHRRSWRHIWKEEVQPRLPHVGQPPEPDGEGLNGERPADEDGKGLEALAGEQPEAPNNKEPEEAPTATTRRPKKAKRPPKEQWAGNCKRFCADALRTANDAIALKNTVGQCTSEQHRRLQEEADTFLLEKLKQGEEALAYVRARLDGSLEEETDTHIRQGRIRTTPARRASAPVQPSV